MEAKTLSDWYLRWGKRLFDIILSISALILLSPVIIFVALVIRLLMGSPVLFSQARPGLHGKPYVIYKFRTMLDLRDEYGNLLPDDQRLTRLGKILRLSSLDELPEFWNVLKGDMSLVGPRPLLLKYMPFFSEMELKRFLLKPGITGWAAVNGRNLTSWDQRLAMDIWYVDNCSLWLDVKILLLTILQVVLRKGCIPVPGKIMLDFDEERKEYAQKCESKTN